MAMTLKCAVFVVVTNEKLALLLEKAKSEGAATQVISDIRREIDKLDPFTTEANDVVIQRTDQEFADRAKQIKSQIEKINEAIADFSKINDALIAAGKIVTLISKLVTFV